MKLLPPLLLAAALALPTAVLARDPATLAHELTMVAFDQEMPDTDPRVAETRKLLDRAVKQTGEAFAKSSSFLRWQDKAANQKFFAGELQSFMKDASKILLEAGVIRKAPEDFTVMYDASFIK